MQVLARHLGSAPKEWLLTHVNELLAEIDQAGTGNIFTRVDEAFAEAQQWMRDDELPELRLILKDLMK